MPFYGDDFFEDEDVVGLSNEAVALYLSLLWRQWKHESLPAEPEKIRALCPRFADSWDALWDEVQGLFPVEEDGRRRQRRAKHERDVRSAISAKLSENGRRGGLVSRARSAAQAELQQGSTKAQASTRPDHTGQDSTTPLPPSRGEPPPAADSRPAAPRGRKAKRAAADLDVELAGRESWLVNCVHDWVAYRREKGVDEFTPTGLRQFIARVERLGLNRFRAAFEHSTSNGYQGFFEPSTNGQASKPSDPEAAERARERRDREAEERRRERESPRIPPPPNLMQQLSAAKEKNSKPVPAETAVSA